MVYFEQQVTLSPETQAKINHILYVLFFISLMMASSIAFLAYAICKKMPRFADLSCDCHRSEGRKQL